MATAPADASPRSKDVPWYIPDGSLADFGSAAQAVFEHYSGIPADRVRAHILQVREQAWQVVPFPCIGQARFLDFSLAAMPSYGAVLDRLRDPTEAVRLLDVGCCFGQDLRRLVVDGAPSGQLVGLDVEPRFIELGYELFRDRATWAGTWVTGDVLDEASDSPVAVLHASVDVVHAASFLHLFDWAGQLAAALALVRFLRDRPGSMVLGRQLGAPDAHARPYPTDASKQHFLHSPQSLRQLWDEVETHTGTRWHVNAWIQETATHAVGAGPKCMNYTVELLYFEVSRES